MVNVRTGGRRMLMPAARVLVALLRLHLHRHRHQNRHQHGTDPRCNGSGFGKSTGRYCGPCCAGWAETGRVGFG